jgi:hypothetical protein
MAQNTAPIYALHGDNSTDDGTTMSPTFTTAAANYTGVDGTNNKLLFTADATNGGIVRGFWLAPLGTNTASVIRFYINNGSANTTAANNSYIGGFSLPATTATNVAAEPSFFYPFPNGGVALKPGFRIYAGLGTTVAAGWVATPVGGQY